MPCWPQMPSSWLSSGCNLSQLFMAANPQGSACFHSPLHHFKSDPSSLDSKHVLVSSLGFGPPQSNTNSLLLVFCPSGRQEQEKRDLLSKMKCERCICSLQATVEDFLFSSSRTVLGAGSFCTCYILFVVFFYKPHVWSLTMMAENPFCVFTVPLFLFFFWVRYLFKIPGNVLYWLKAADFWIFVSISW